MFGALRKLLGIGENTGAAAGRAMSGIRDASQMPRGMNFDRQPMDVEGIGGTNPPLPRGMVFQSGIRDQRAKDVAPFRMFEDGSFQGNPSRFLQTNPRYTFYEDNSFSAPPELSVGNADGYGQLDESQVMNPQGWGYGVNKGYLTNPMPSQRLQGGNSLQRLLNR